MPSAAAPASRADSTAPDDLDNLFNYDNAVEDFLKDLPAADNSNTNEDLTRKRLAEDDDFDKEIKQVKKRKPVPKLDEDRLLSDQGIPKLKRIAKSRVKFQGKGHEYSDVSRLLNTYQLWLDDLYPRAKFRDALTMVEKVGHKKKMQVYRKSWIDDSKPTRRELTPVEVSGQEEVHTAEGGREAMMSGGPGDSEQGRDGAGSVQRPLSGADGAPEEDELDALLAESGGQELVKSQTDVRPPAQKPSGNGDEPDEDELDALLGADESHAHANNSEPPASRRPNRKAGPFEDDSDEDDELDALLDAQASHGAGAANSGNNRNAAQGDIQNRKDEAFADEEDIMAEMGW